MRKVLIMGISGFTGIHLWNYIKTVGEKEVVGTYHAKLTYLQRKFLRGCVLKKCDINDFSQIVRILKSVKPEQIYFLPAIVTVRGAFGNARAIYKTNILGITNFYEAVISSKLNPRILFVGSAEEYGKVKKDVLPLKEQQPLNPVNPYGVSKMIQEQLSCYYRKIHGLNISITRTFHFTGPLQPPNFVISDFAYQIAQIESGKQEGVIRVGNLDAKRDFTDIRDVVRAYYLIINNIKEADIFNVCSGYSVSIRTILQKLLARTDVKVLIQKDPQKLRKLDVPDFKGDNSKLIAKTGWKREISMDKMLTDVLDWHRQHLGK